MFGTEILFVVRVPRCQFGGQRGFISPFGMAIVATIVVNVNVPIAVLILKQSRSEVVRWLLVTGIGGVLFDAVFEANNLGHY